MGLETGRSGGDQARRRWNILARAIRNHCRSPSPSVSSLGLVGVEASYSPEWFVYTCAGVSLKIRHVAQSLTPEDLMGFNSTGNVCVWPSEEVLAYLSLVNLNLFDGKSILELGGGMSCLAGLFIAKYSSPSLVHLTDGNKSSVENVRKIIEENGLGFNSGVSVETLRWADIRPGISQTYDFILAADCLFFDEARRDLVLALWNSLKNNGTALVTAPRRGMTLEHFVSLCRSTGFFINVSDRYSDHVWTKHLDLLHSSQTYNPDSNYPILIQLHKSSVPNIFH